MIEIIDLLAGIYLIIGGFFFGYLLFSMKPLNFKAALVIVFFSATAIVIWPFYIAIYHAGNYYGLNEYQTELEQ